MQRGDQSCFSLVDAEVGKYVAQWPWGKKNLRTENVQEASFDKNGMKVHGRLIQPLNHISAAAAAGATINAFIVRNIS
jgi:hypothetical protein